ncbi:hypothetical protein LLH00_17770 [bacterium]|nr:hypothetical protein [bacterium]
MMSRVRPLIALTALALVLVPLGLLAQNTAPVPTTFEIISPPDGNASSLINTNFSTNKRVFYGGDFFYPTSNNNVGGFLGFTDILNKNTTVVARGNTSGSRLTLGGTEYGSDPDFGTSGGASVANLPGSRILATSYDPDDLGGGSYLVYTGMNGFIAINEGDTLEINISGFIDPNNKMVKGDQAADQDFTGRNLKSQNGDGTSGYDGANNVTFTALNLPAGATFVGNRLRWVPSFVQGDGATDNSIHGGRYFVDANISNGSTTSETSSAAGDTSSSAVKVGVGVGELRDSLYVIYFKATDDSNQGNDTAIDSLFIMVNDSLPNPTPRFTKRTMLRKDSLGVSQTRAFNYLAGVEDTLFSVFEGDSVVLTFYAQDQDSLQGESNDPIAFGLLWNDNLKGVPKGGTTTGPIAGFNQFIHRAGTVDTLLADTVSSLTGGAIPSFKVKLQIPFNLATSDEKADTLVVMVSDGTTIAADTFALKVRNTNRAPIWDGDSTSLPPDSALVFSPNPAAAKPDSIQVVGPFTLNNNQTDSTYFSRYVYDPDFLCGDSLGWPLSFSHSGDYQGALNTSTGLNVFRPSVSDTLTYTFNITATDNNSHGAKSSAQQVRFRVAPAPTISRVTPAKGSINQEFTIFGSGFGLFDRNVEDTSKVIFYATDLNGRRQNIAAKIISWAKDKIVASVPSGVPVSRLDRSLSFLVPDTIKVISAIYGGFDTYPFTVLVDSGGYENIEVVNISATSAMLRYRTNFNGADSIVVAASSDTLDIHSAAFTDVNKFNGFPTFVEYNSGLSEIRSSVTVFKDETSADDGIHVIQLTNLSPGTLYRFFIGSSNGVFAADSLRNINGPYRPKKVDRTTAAKNSTLTAFKLRTLPSSGTNSSMYTLKGKVYYSGGAAVNATVRLKVVDATSTADTSLPLVATVGSDSLWELNLANLRKSDGSGFSHAQGDYLLLEFDGAEKGFEQYDTLRAADAASPMAINKVKLVPYVSYDLELKTGLNLIGLPLNLFKGQPSTAHAILGMILGGTPALSRYVSSTGMQESITRAISGSYVGAADFNIAIEDGYFIKVNSENHLLLEGRAFTRNVPIIQFPAAGQFFVSRPAQDDMLFRSWDANSVLKAVTGIQAIYRYEPSTQEYKQYFKDGTSYRGENFGIDVGQGYIFQVTAASSWNPNVSGTLLAADNTSGATKTPSIALDLGNRSVAGNAPGIHVSNVTSSAATFTWAATVQTPGVLHMTDPDGRETLVQPRTLEGGFSYALVSGLKSGVEYRYSVDGLSGQSVAQTMAGTLTTAQLGAGLNLYTLYGRLTDSQDQPLAGMLVFLKLTGAESGEQTGTICAATDRDGMWTLNLANLKESGSGIPYKWSAGDKIDLTVLGLGVSRSFSSTVKPESPHNFALDLQAGSEKTATDASSGNVPAVLPKSFSLAQNSPNPFNPSTTIRYAVPEGAGLVSVRLDVFNLRGQMIRNLVTALREPGEYQVEWDGTDSAGRRASSGVYFYRLTTPSFRAMRKMIILK